MLVSPWFLLIFLIIPALVILSVTLHIRLPLSSSTQPLLVNNGCFALLVLVRFLRYLAVLGKPIRYGAGSGRPRQGVTLAQPAAQVRAALGQAGYFFGVPGYGEKRDLGFVGTTMLYGGLVLVLAVGTLDNLRQFSGTLLDAMGPATKLSRPESYRSLIMGPLAPKPDKLPNMKVMAQYPPSSQYPHGATEIVLIDKSDKVVASKIVQPNDPLKYGDYDFIMAKFLMEPLIVIKTKDGKPVVSGQVRLEPVVRKEGAYGFHAPFKAGEYEGLVYYRSDNNKLKVVMKHKGEWMFDTEMKFQTDQVVEQNGYLLTCEKLGKWTEIHVVRRRHMPLLMAGGAIVLLGLLMRAFIRPQRVWIEEEGENSRVWSVGADAAARLKA